MMRPRRGVILPLVVLALTIMLMMVAWSSSVVSATSAVPRARRQALQMDAATVTALGYVLDEWPVAWRTMAINGTDTRAYSINGVSVNATVTRITTDEYRASFATSGANFSGTRTATLARRALTLAWNEPIASMGPVAFASGATIYGSDAAACTPAAAEAAGLRMPPAQTISPNSGTFTSPSSAQRVTDNTMTAGSLSLLGGFTLADIQKTASLIYPNGTTLASTDLNGNAGPTSGVCTVGWGSPTATTGCQTFFPVIWAQGSLTLTGGVGQGVILADGLLTIGGGTQFYGIIISRGGVTLNSAVIHGRIINVNASATLTLNAGATVMPSSCAIARLQNSRALARPVARASIFDAVSAGALR